ncbi:MAG: hypothetical protein ACRECV_04170 [Xanthobacteraceae bacterium]
MGKPRSKESEYVERQQAAANAKEAMLEKFRARAADHAAVPAETAPLEGDRKARTEQKTSSEPRDTAGTAKSNPSPGAKKARR